VVGSEGVAVFRHKRIDQAQHGVTFALLLVLS